MLSSKMRTRNQVWEPAMELTTEELQVVLKGRKVFFDKFYFTIAKNLPRRERQFFTAVAKYRDKYVDILSTPYMTNYTLFLGEDRKVVFDVCGLTQKEVDDEITVFRKFISEECKLKGFSAPNSLFENLTADRLIMMLMIRFYMERNNREKIGIVSQYMGYSMYFSTFTKFFPHGVRAETMVYTINNLTNKHKLKQEGTVEALLKYGVEKCAESYKSRIMDATDSDLVYVIQQCKSRLRGYFRDIANKYFENDANKEAVFTSRERLQGDDDDAASFVDRESSTGVVDQMASRYTNNFYRTPIDSEIVNMVCRINQVSKPELMNALSQIRNDKSKIIEVRSFYESIFYLYSEQNRGRAINVQSRQFMAAMDVIYRKGNSKEKNITAIKRTLDTWLKQFSDVYRDANRSSKLSGYRKAIFQYFVFVVALRK